jgi:hypothetical protein
VSDQVRTDISLTVTGAVNRHAVLWDPGVVMGQCFVTGEMCRSALEERRLISRAKRKKRAEQAD